MGTAAERGGGGSRLSSLWEAEGCGSGGIAEELGLWMLVAVEEKGFQEGDGIEFLAFGGVEDGEIDGEGVSALGGAVAKDDFAEDDGQAEGLFGMVVGGRHAVDVEEGEETVVVAFGIEEPDAEGLGIGVRNGVGAKGMELVVEPGDPGLGDEDGKVSGVPLTAQSTSLREEATKGIAERDGGGVVLRCR